MPDQTTLTFSHGAGDDKFGYCQALIDFGKPAATACLRPQHGVVIIRGERFAVCADCYFKLQATAEELARHAADS